MQIYLVLDCLCINNKKNKTSNANLIVGAASIA